MSDIENIKAWLDKIDTGNWIAQDDCPICSGNGFKIYNDESGFECDECNCLIPESRTFNANAHEWLSSLITTIESQKEEIAELREREYNEYPRIILELETRIFKLQDDANTQEAITELAVTCLQRIDSIRETFPISFQPHHVEAAFIKAERLTTDTLSEIERLQNEK